MKKLNIFAMALAFAAVVGFVSLSSAYPRSAGGRAQSVTEEAGDTMTPYNTSIGTTTAVAVYTKTSNFVDRVWRICNDQADTYRLLVSTSSSINGLATTQDVRTLFHVAPNTCDQMVAPSQTLYAVFKATSTTGTLSTGRAYGFKRYDSRD